MPQHKKNWRHGLLKKRHFIYDLVENTECKKKAPIDIILTQFVEGVGEEGQKLSISPLKAYNNLLLPGLAVYASPENIKKYRPDDKVKAGDHSSIFAPRTTSFLSTFQLNVMMSLDNPWTLEIWHIRMAFRKAGIFLNDDCITMPERPIIGPNREFENKEFYVNVTINKREKVNVRCRLYYWTNDPNKSVITPIESDLKPSEPIFPEDKPILDSIPIPYRTTKALEKLETNQSLK